MENNGEKLILKLSTLINIFFLLLSTILVLGGVIGWFQLDNFKDSLRNEIATETQTLLPTITTLKEKVKKVNILIAELEKLKKKNSDQLSKLKNITDRQLVANSPGVLLAMARNALDKEKDIVESTKFLAQLLDTDSNQPGEYINAALFAKSHLSNKTLVRKLLDKALEIAPNNILAKAVRYEYLSYEVSKEKMNADIKQMAKEHGGDPSIVKALANYYIEIGDYKGLEKIMLLIATANPMSAPCYRNLAVASEELRKDSKKIVTYYEKAISYSSNDDTIHARYAHYLKSLGKIDEALKQFKIASEMDPTDANYYYNIALILYKLGQFDVAKSNVKLSIALSPNLSRINMKSAVLLRRIEMSW